MSAGLRISIIADANQKISERFLYQELEKWILYRTHIASSHQQQILRACYTREVWFLEDLSYTEPFQSCFQNDA